MKQLRIATIGDWDKFFSYYLEGTMQGSILNEHLLLCWGEELEGRCRGEFL
jgi:hypothetical protein